MPNRTALPSQNRHPVPPTRRRRAAWALAGLVLAAHVAMLQTASLWMLSTPVRAAVPTPENRPAVWVRQTVAEVPTPPPATAASPVGAPDAAASIMPAARIRSSDAAKPAQPDTGSQRQADLETGISRREPTVDGDAELLLRPAATPGDNVTRLSESPIGANALASRTEPAPEPEPDAATLAARAEPVKAAPPRSASGIDSTLLAPPSAQLTYSLQRGMLRGTGVLAWRNEGPRYRMSLEGELPLIGTFFSQQSEGGFDAAGVAPLRHTERRLRRSERAVNFVRPDDGSAARITFSASTASLPLHAGAQDRLSWMAQLATRLAGVRKLAAGASLEMDVASTGGDVQHWVFVLQGVESDGSWHWRRDSDHPTDTRAEVWTDPAQSHWPRRVRLSETNSEPLELTLLSLRRPSP